jgi:thiamine-phosphate pyrophosphorylase
MTFSRRLEGLYLVVAPILPFDRLLVVVEKALTGGVDIMQFVSGEEASDTVGFGRDLSHLAKQHGVPFLINGKLQLMQEVGADGMHFDTYDTTPGEVRRKLGGRYIVGYTLGNDLERLKWAEDVGADYISFCSIFPTSSATQCEIVPIETVKAARSKTNLPIFAAGGIDLQNADLVLEAGADGIAVVSAILKARNPDQVARTFKDIIRKHRTCVS